MRLVRSAIVQSVALCAALCMSSCQTTVTTSDGTAPAPKPTDGPVTPAGTVPNAIAVTFAPKPADTNGNMFPDTLHITAYLFARPHPAPLFADGAFHFSIYRMGESGTTERVGENPLRTWAFDADAVTGARSVALVGPCYEFELSLLVGSGSDNLPVESVDLIAWFEPRAGGERVWLRGVRSVQFSKPQR